jgi:tripartite-type tricarboxylate transporter receptor subunit TctC
MREDILREEVLNMRISYAKLVAAALALVVPAAAAQEYPAREIRALCNFAAGSGADVIVRYYSDKLSKLAGRPVLVENKPGAAGTIATDTVAKAKPDGYTILITPASATLVAAPHLFKSLPFDPTKDFTAVTTIATVSFAILVDAARPIHSIPELIAQLRVKPNEGFYGTSSVTGIISAELFKQSAGLKTAYIPFKANPQALTSLLQGELDFLSYDATWAVAQQRGGRLRVLAVTSSKRSIALPDTPTLAELGFSDTDMTPWWGVVVPAGTPKPVVDKLADWFNQITATEETRQFLERTAFDPFPGTPESMAALLKSDAPRWARYVKLAKIEPQ